jgi:hypothetical protein
MNEGGAAPLQALLQGLQDSLARLFALRRQANARLRTQLHRQLLLGLRLMWQIDEQVVLPVLYGTAGASGAADTLRQATDELGLMRDLAMLATRTNSSNRDVALAVLEGLSMLHYVRLDLLLGAAPADAANWMDLESEVRSLLRRWPGDVPADTAAEHDDDAVGEDDDRTPR